MRRARITVTLNQVSLGYLDQFISRKFATNRSQAIEKIVTTHFSSHVHQAVILAGGKGTNMRPYTYELPKSMLPLQGKPILFRLIEQLREAHIHDVTICTGYLGKKIEQYFGDGRRFQMNIRYAHEDKPLLTGGPLAQIQKTLHNEPFLLLHGDIVTDLSFKDIIDFHLKEESLVTVGLTLVEDPSAYGQLKLYGTQLVEFHNRIKQKKGYSHLVNAGIYVCDPKLFEFFPQKKAFYFEDVLKSLIEKKKVHGFLFEKKWFDVGTLTNYEQAIKAYSSHT